MAETTGPAMATPGTTAVAVADARTAKVGALFRGGLEGKHFCTASVVDSPRRDLIVTAAHCVGDDHEELAFVPGYHDGQAPHGIWALEAVHVSGAWSKDSDPEADLAFVRLAPLEGREIQDVVGAAPLGREEDAAPVTVVGYPNSREAPLTCTNVIAAHGAMHRRIHCPAYSSGTSGSPWLHPTGAIVGILGGHEGGGILPDISYGTVLDDRAMELYQRAVQQR
ncbi:trypsin-like serine peptidase [Streptomyces sp. NBC_01304]|uniref:trypsin-like serine peptidase n=1 Tax=Streptomyces sp. NBC_01304 TaxID=2903818 RepID=UPI002E10939A|nr:serine protease [Streptomyces sp. NBC_01304]